jgi:predicted nuclease of predicted toxin-antitoxin system
MNFLVDRCAGRRLADWLREHGHDVRQRIALMEQLLARYEQELESGAVLTVGRERVRISRPPPRED